MSNVDANGLIPSTPVVMSIGFRLLPTMKAAVEVYVTLAIEGMYPHHHATNIMDTNIHLTDHIMSLGVITSVKIIHKNSQSCKINNYFVRVCLF